MSGLLEQLVDKAFDRAHGSEANVAIDRVRSERGGVSAAVSYEIVVPAVAIDEFLVAKALPKLVYFLDCRGARLEARSDVFVSLFTEQGLFFFDAGDFALRVGASRGLEAAELVRRYGANGAGDPLLLGT